MFQRSFVLLLLFIAIMVIPLSGVAEAQTGNNERIGFVKGSVKTVNGTLIELNGGGPIFDISGVRFVEVRDASVGVPASFITVGTIISKAQVMFRDGQSIAEAQTVTIEFPDFSVLTGRIESIDPASSSIVVLNQRIVFTNSSIFVATGNGRPPSFDRLKVGKFIKVTTRLSESGEGVVAVVATTDRSLINFIIEEDE
jgi:hypothetical protein